MICSGWSTISKEAFDSAIHSSPFDIHPDPIDLVQKVIDNGSILIDIDRTQIDIKTKFKNQYKKSAFK